MKMLCLIDVFAFKICDVYKVCLCVCVLKIIKFNYRLNIFGLDWAKATKNINEKLLEINYPKREKEEKWCTYNVK